MNNKFPILKIVNECTYELKVVVAPPWEKLVLIPKPNKITRIDKHVAQSFEQQISLACFLSTSWIFRSLINAWIPGANPAPIPVLVPNGLLRLKPEVCPKLKVLGFPNGGGLAPNPPVLVPVILHWIHVTFNYLCIIHDM